VDISKKPWEQDKPLHNRWHPDIPAVAEVCNKPTTRTARQHDLLCALTVTKEPASKLPTVLRTYQGT
jgi:hypothetical protein